MFEFRYAINIFTFKIKMLWGFQYNWKCNPVENIFTVQKLKSKKKVYIEWFQNIFKLGIPVPFTHRSFRFV